MKKTLIALTLAALPVASMADVILYGQIKGGVEVTKEKNVAGTTTNIVDYGSRIGFKGHEQLNGSLQAIWQLEQDVNIGGGERGFGTRDSFIGLKGDSFGTVKVGYQSTPLKEVVDKVDIWEYDSEYAGLARFTRTNDAVRRYTAISYETPNFGGFTAKAYLSPSNNNKAEPGTYLFDETEYDPVNNTWNTVTVNRPRKSDDGAVYGLRASYQHEKGFFADVAGTYVRHGNNNLTEKDYGYQVLAQGGFDNGKWMAAGAYQYANGVDKFNNNGAAIDSARGHEVAVSGAYTFNDAFRLKGSLAYGFGFKTVGSNYDVNGDGYANERLKAWGNGKYFQAVVGGDYLLSKRTTANAQIGYRQQGSGDDKERGGTLSVGLKHKF